MPTLITAIQIIAIQIFTVAVLILLLRMLFYRNLDAALKRLRALHEEGLIKEAQLKEELERAKQERLSKVEEGKEEAKIIIEVARRECDDMRSKAENQAKLEAEDIVYKAMQEVERFKTQILYEMEDVAVNLSLQIIQHIFTSEGRENLQHQLVDELIPEIERLEKEKLSAKTNKVKISSAFALTETQRARLREILSQKIGPGIEIEERLDPQLITGLVIEIDVLVIDGSLKNKLKKVALYLKGGK
jgi:F-type H+-transporting ATPase subunit b